MKLLLTLFFTIGCLTFSYAQFTPVKKLADEPKILDDIYRRAKNKAKYKNNLWRYLYEIEMKDGSILNVNSDVLKDPGSGKYFFYYSNNDSVKQIFPNETTKITRENPYNRYNIIEGFPNGENGDLKF